jgi:hypothetical protein
MRTKHAIIVSDDPDACWSWRGCTDGNGYAQFKNQWAHALRSPVGQSSIGSRSSSVKRTGIGARRRGIVKTYLGLVQKVT